jgi:hypothetical protein
MPGSFDHLDRDRNGCPIERISIGDRVVIVHYDDLPQKDTTTVRGIPCTTALRTLIDLAPELDEVELRRMVQHCLDHRLFTVEAARERIAEHDMVRRPGAELLGRALPS